MLPGAATLAGAAVGVVRPKERLLLGEPCRAGDAILIAPATGIHANGLTLARHVAAGLPEGYGTPVPGDPAGARLRRGAARPGAALRPAGRGPAGRRRAPALRRARHRPRLAQADARGAAA